MVSVRDGSIRASTRVLGGRKTFTLYDRWRNTFWGRKAVMPDKAVMKQKLLFRHESEVSHVHSWVEGFTPTRVILHLPSMS